MIISISEKDYKILADESYKIDKNKINQPLRSGQVIKSTDLSVNYKILHAEDNTENGIQAMAVAPINKQGIVDTSNIIIASPEQILLTLIRI